MVRGFKSATTTRINTARDTPGNPVWLRNYYERVIRAQPCRARYSAPMTLKARSSWAP